MSLTRLFVNRPTLVFVIVALMTFAGVVSTMTIVKQLFPNVSQPTVTINVQYNGASVTEMRDNIVAPIEQQLAGTTDLQTINSTVQQGTASIVAVYYLGSDIATDVALTQKAVQSAEKELPTNLTPPVIQIRDPSQSVVISLGVFSSKLSTGQLSLIVDNVIVPRIQQIKGISNVFVGGDVIPAYEVEADPAKLAARNLTLNDLINTLTNDNQRVPGGIAYAPNRETTIDVRGDITTPNTIANLPVIVSGSAAPNGLSTLPGGVDTWTASNAVTRIGDVAKVVAGNELQRRYAQVNGRPGLFLFVQKASDASEVDSSENVLHDLPQIERQFPELQFKLLNTQSRFTTQQIDLVTRTLTEAMILTGIAMLFFLRSWRSAIVVCIAIPTSLAIAMTAMKMLGMTLDMISLLGMSLVIGILVDDSTVVLENIERHFTHLGESPEDAAVNGRQEIGAAAVVITLVDVVVFFPIALVQGQVGRFLWEFAIVVVISTLTSLFVSFTITPTLAGLWALRSHWKAPKIIDAFGDFFDRLREWYVHSALPWALARKGIVAGVCAISFVIAIALVPLGLVGEEFVPTTDRGQIYIQAVFPVGTPLETVKTYLFKLERWIDKQGDVGGEATSAGAYSASFGAFVYQGNVGQIVVFLKDDRKEPTSWWATKFSQVAKTIIPQADIVSVPSTQTSGGNQQPIDMIVSDIYGGDPTAASNKVLALLKSIPNATHVSSSGSELAPQIEVVFDRTKMNALNVDIADAANAAGAAFGGNQVTQFETPQGLEEVQVIYPVDLRSSFKTLAAVPIRTETGAIIHLGDIATFRYEPTPPIITRTDRDNVVHVTGNYVPGSSLSAVQNAFFKKLPSLHLPPNIVVKATPLGSQEFMNQTLRGLGASMIFSVILVFLLMVALYNSYSSPFIIMFSVPVAAVGALGALMITHKTLNLFSLIGSILLIGIATKNGILLVDYANTLRSRGLDKLAAIKESAHTRFRPIIMTSFSIVAANIPLALGFEPGSGARTSLGTVIIGGVLSSLFLTLLLVPIAYMWLAPKDWKVPKEQKYAQAHPPAEVTERGLGVPT
ncbi:MAG TPA: efflux RND transporter permease subunit [Candidatus Acidoferrales bacterium]|nr:efflux RND transporter permease subunit [Candidatus Acidoferrales bacterium]